MNGKPWLPEHSATLYAMHATHHDGEIAAITGHDVFTVMRRRQALGLAPHYGSKYGRWEDIPAFSLAAIKRAARVAA